MRWQERSAAYETCERGPTWGATYLIAALLVAMVGIVDHRRRRIRLDLVVAPHEPDRFRSRQGQAAGMMLVYLVV